jgi:hypothetical protein
MWPQLLLSGGLGILGKLFGGGKQTTAFQMSPEQKSLLAQLQGQMQNVPGSVTAPFVRERKRIQQSYARQPGMSGVQSGMLTRLGGRESEAAGAYKRGILGQMQALLSGTGTTTTEARPGWGDVFGGIGGDIGMLWALKDILGTGKSARRFD